MTDLDLISPLSAKECVSRLRGAIDAEIRPGFSIAALIGAQPVLGKVDERSFILHKRITGRNYFQSYLTGTLKDVSAGTLIHCRFRIDPVVRFIQKAWFIALAVIGCIIFLSSAHEILNGGARRPSEWLGVFIPVALLTFGIVLDRLARYLARDEPEYLIEFVAQTLGAQVESRSQGETQ